MAIYVQLADRLLKVSNDVSLETITDALGYVPFNGEFNELKNSPFTEDNSGEYNVVDEAGNIILKINQDGVKTTKLHIPKGDVQTQIDDISGNITILEQNLENLGLDIENISFESLKDNPITITEGEFIIMDDQDPANVGLKLNTEGLFVRDVYLDGNSVKEKLGEIDNTFLNVDGELTQIKTDIENLDSDLDNFKFTDLNDNPIDITGNEFIITDDQNPANVGFKLNDAGIFVKDVIIDGESTKGKFGEVDNRLGNLDGEILRIDGEIENIHTEIDNISFENIKNNPIDVSGSEFIIMDDQKPSNVGLKLNSEGLFVKDVIIAGESVDNRLDVLDSQDIIIGGRIDDVVTDINNMKDSFTTKNLTVTEKTAISGEITVNGTMVTETDSVVQMRGETEITSLTTDDIKTEGDELRFSDNEGNTVALIDDLGISAFEVNVMQNNEVIHRLSEKANQQYVDDKILTLLTTVATHTTNIEGLSGTVSTLNSKAVLKEGTQTITGRKTFTVGPNFAATGDTNAIAIGYDTRFNLLSGDTITDDTILGMISNKATLGHENYETQVRGKKISVGSNNSKTTIQGSDTKLTYNGKNLAFEEDTVSKLKTLKFTYGISAGKTGTITYDGTKEEVLYIPTSIGHLNSNDTKTFKSEIIESAITFTTSQGYATQTWVNDKGYLTSSSLNGYAKTSDVNKKQNTISDLTTIRNNASSGATAYGWGNHANAGYAKTSDVNKKQNTISDLATIRSNASSGATAYGWGDHSKKGYLTSSSLNGYAKTSDVNKKQDAISDLATIRSNASSGATAYGWGDHSKKGYLTSSALSGYAKEDWVTSYVVSAVTGGQVSLDGYATEEWVNSKGYLTEHQDISNLATKSEVEALTADVVENEYAMSTALNQIIVSAGFDTNGISTLPSGETLTNAIKRLDNACANATEGLKYSTERAAYVTTFTYVSEDGGSENYEITTEQRNYNIETHRKAFNGEICTLNVSGMIYNYIYTMGNITNGSVIFATTDLLKRHIQIQANGNCLSFAEEIQVNLEGYATEDWVTEYVVSAVTGGQVSLDGYATENWVNSKNYLTSSSLSGYAKTSDVNKKQDAISDLATIRSNASSGATAYGWGDHSKKGYLTSSSLSGYAKTSDLASYLSKSGGQINGSLIINDESHNHITLTDDGEMYYDAKISYSDGTLGVYSGNRIDILSPISVKSKITVSNEYSGFTCTNLNADLLDGKHASEFMLKTDSVTYDDITDAPLIDNNDGEFHLVDENDYKIASFNNGGLFTTKVTAINGFFQNSDETLKEFKNDIEIDFERLKNIPKVYYTWKDDTEENLQIGTSAQKVQEIYPELTSRDADSGKLALDYAKLSIIALKAIDTLHEENKLLRKELEELKEKVNTKRTRKKKTE
jgi:hypothetical protein